MFLQFKKIKNKRSKRKITVEDRRILLDDIFVDYTLRQNPRCKSVRLAISTDGDLTVSAPPRVSLYFIEHFINLKKDWIIEKTAGNRTVISDGVILNKNPEQNRAIKKNVSKNEYKKYKDYALQIATEKVEKWNLHYKFKYNKISIKNQKTRWGSCSRHGNLNFSYKIALLPDNLADYLVVHELCHLGEFNHSHKFWALVAQTIPDYKNIRPNLKSWSKGGDLLAIFKVCL